MSGALMGLLGMFGGQQQPPQGNSFGGLLGPQDQQGLQQRGLLGFLGGMANSGALDYTVPFISGKVPGGLPKGLAAGAAGMGEAQDAGLLNFVRAKLTG